MVVADRIDARAVPIPRLLQNVVCPEIGASDRKARGPEADHLGATDVLENLLRALNILSKLRGGLIRDSNVIETVTCNLVTGL